MKITVSRASQIIFLLIFAYLFVITEYRGKDEISLAVNSFFRIDPLVVLNYILSAKTFTAILVPGMLMILFTALLGRFFCGWICPLGTIIDLFTGKIKKTKPLRFLKGNLKYYLLFTLLFVSLFNINLAGVFDPIAILVRALTLFFYPLLGETARQGWVGLYSLIGEHRDYVSFIYAFLKDTILPFRETFYPLAFASSLMLALIIFIERFETRNWCRNLCPLGALLGLLSCFSLFRRIPRHLCKDCHDCKDLCPTAFDREILNKQDCVLCLDCAMKCRFKRVEFRPMKFKHESSETHKGLLIPRRVFLGSFLGGFLLSRTFSFTNPYAKERLLRPPGVNDENEFLKKCVRCGECIKVCVKNALYPAGFQAGLYGIFSPILIARSGYCEYNCTLCGQVCPTQAIPMLPVEQKKKELIGLAVIDKNHCLPFSKKLNCIVCEEHCPIPKKAIRFEIVNEKNYAGRIITLKKPYVVDELCNGCGICEFVCPLEGKSAIEIFARKGIKAGIQTSL